MKNHQFSLVRNFMKTTMKFKMGWSNIHTWITDDTQTVAERYC